MVIHEQLVVSAMRDEILGVNRTPEVNCKPCAEWLDRSVEFFLCHCEKGEEN